MSESSAQYGGTQSVSRAIALLKSFSDEHPEWHVNELAEANGLNLSTTYRLLATLESEGLLSRRPDSRLYRLGPEMIALGGCALRSHDLRTVARPYLQALAESTGEAATLEVLAGRQVIVVDETSGHHLVGMSQDVGSRLPVHATSTGKALLAYAEEELVADTLAAPLNRLTDKTIVSAERLRQDFAEVRRRGFATARDELETGFTAIAAPVFNHEDAAIAAISVGGPSVRLSPRLETVAAHVVDAAQRISAQLGHRHSRSRVAAAYSA